MTSQTPRTDTAERQSHHPYNDLAHRQDGHTGSVEIQGEASRPPCSVQRLVLPDLATFREWFYGTEAMNHADNDVYVTAKTLIPELYALLQSKVEGVTIKAAIPPSP